MAKSISARLGLTRWSAGPDTWSRAELDANFGQLEALVGVVRADTAANRGTPLRNLEWFVATDTGLVSFGRVAGGSWVDFGRLGSANTWTALGSFTAGLSVSGGLTVDSITASKSIYGAIGVMSFTNEAARDSFYTSIGGVVGTQRCLLSNPTAGRPGFYFYDGTRWRPEAGHYVEATQSAGNTVNLGIAVPVTVTFNAPTGYAVDTTAGMWSPSTGIFTASYACTVMASGAVSSTVVTVGDFVAAGFLRTGGGGSASNLLGNTESNRTTAANQRATANVPTVPVAMAAGDTLKLMAYNGSTASPTVAGLTHIGLHIL